MQRIFSFFIVALCLIFAAGGCAVADSDKQKEQGKNVEMSATMEQGNETSQKGEEMKGQEAAEENKDMSSGQETAEESMKNMEEKK